MAKIFNPPSEVKAPTFNWADIKQYRADCDKYKADLKEALQRYNPNGKNVGEVIKFPVADGYAEYMVANMKPVELVHIPLWDAWNFAHAHLLTAKAVQAEIDKEKRIAELFANKKK